MKDQDQYSPAQMLKEIWEQEDSCHPANTTPKPPTADSSGKGTGQYDRKNQLYAKGHGYAMRQAEIQPVPPMDNPESQSENNYHPHESYDKGYYVVVVNTTDEINCTWGRCFNCGKEGHQW